MNFKSLIIYFMIIWISIYGQNTNVCVKEGRVMDCRLTDITEVKFDHKILMERLYFRGVKHYLVTMTKTPKLKFVSFERSFITCEDVNGLISSNVLVVINDSPCLHKVNSPSTVGKTTKLSSRKPFKLPNYKTTQTTATDSLTNDTTTFSLPTQSMHENGRRILNVYLLTALIITLSVISCIVCVISILGCIRYRRKKKCMPKKKKIDVLNLELDNQSSLMREVNIENISFNSDISIEDFTQRKLK